MNAVLAVLDAVINTLWQAVAITAAVWLALRFLPRINAATRHAIWWATLAVVLMLPVAPRILSALRSHPTPVSEPKPAPRTTALPSPETQPFIIRVTPDRTAKWPRVILAIWTAILLRRLFQIARSYAFLRGMKQRAAVSAIPLPVIPRRATLLVSNEVVSPMAVGFLHPAVILPEALLGDLTDAEREHVLLHEAAHLAGYDDWSNLAMRLLGGALARHPVAIWILRRIEREREIACDDWVVARTGAARPYAESLAHLFELREAKRNEMLASGIFGRHSRLGDRIELLLQRGRVFSPRTSPKSFATSSAALAVLMLGSSLAPRWIAFGQQKEEPHFEAASIKRNSSGEPGPQYRMGPRSHVESATVQDLVRLAYAVQDFQVLGGSGWINSDRYDIDATASAISQGEEEISLPRLRLQTLLRDRFRLALHHETKELPIYYLTISKGGLKLQPLHDGSCVPFDADKFRAPGSDPLSFCGYGGFGRGSYEAASASMTDLANAFSTAVGRIVVDKTGIAGAFRVHLTYESTGLLADSVNPVRATEGSPSIFTAVQDQLGLKLESAKGPVEILVIEHAERPDAN